MTLYKFARAIIKFGLKFKYKTIVNYKQEIPNDRGLIVAANHQSNMDPVFLACVLKRQVNYMAKEELFENKIFGSLLNRVGTFKVTRGVGDTSAIDKSVEIVEGGKVLGIFPEGTRSKDGNLKRAKSGIVLVASKSGGDIVPAGITYKKRKFKRELVTVNFGNVIPHDKFKLTDHNKNDLKAASAVIMDSIAVLIRRDSDN